jgi:hypothetical protein
MGVNARIYLPPPVRLDYVSIALAIAGGARWENFDLQEGTGVQAVRVPSLDLRSPGGAPCIAAVEFRDSMRNERRHLLYYFEFGDKGERGLMPASRPYWLAVGKKLVDTFGGRIDYSDFDDCHNDYEVENRWPEDWEDTAFVRLEDMLRAIQPVTREEIRAMEKFAAYSESDF